VDALIGRSITGMQLKWTIGHISGIPIRVHLNWFLTAGLITWALSAGYFPYVVPGGQAGVYWSVGTATALLFFLSVLLHELGHSLTAQREGVPVNSITLFIFGGVAHIAKEPPTAGSEFRIVAAGPGTSLALAAIFSVVGWSGLLGSYGSAAGLYLGQMNVILALFNLLPGFPLDGGRILRAGLWRWLNDFQRATSLATYAGFGIAVLFVAAGVFFMWRGDFFSGGWVAFVGWYLGMAARDGYRQVDLAPDRDEKAAVNSPDDREGFLLQPRDSSALRNTFWVAYPQTYSPRLILVNPERKCPRCTEKSSSPDDWYGEE
jgi:Zn-dependent protease